ncbi:MAG: hypothetical protein IPN67_07660 [Bacteroidales bacterium]|nr:hypothetical protein [Bacteroidales bacterium]
MSDVNGDPLDVIASDLQYLILQLFHQALDIVRQFDLENSLPESILSCLIKGAEGIRSETPKSEDKVFAKTHNILIGNNKLALEASKTKAAELNLNTEIISDRIDGDVSEVSEYIIKTALKYQGDSSVTKPCCLLFGGEPTVKVSGTGMGGRNQHLALYCSEGLRDLQGITILSAGTDGNDGPTSAAGAVVDCSTHYDAVSRSVIPSEYLERYDSFNFFRQAGGHIITGPTMTNVMDIIVVIVE